MVYKRVIINGEVYPGEEVKYVVFPAPTQPYWQVYLTKGRTIYVMDRIVVEVKE